MGEKRVYSTKLLCQWLKERNIGAMDLVRLAGVSVSTAYRIKKGQDMYDLDVFLKVYEGLKRAGYEIEWTQILEMVV